MWVALMAVFAIAVLSVVVWRLYRRIGVLEELVEARALDGGPRRRLRSVKALAPAAVGYVAARAQANRPLATLLLVATTAAIIALVAVDLDDNDNGTRDTTVPTRPGPAMSPQPEPPEIEVANGDEPAGQPPSRPPTVSGTDDPGEAVGTTVDLTVIIETPPPTTSSSPPPSTTTPTTPLTTPPTTTPPTTEPTVPPDEPPADGDDLVELGLPGLAGLSLDLGPVLPSLLGAPLPEEPDLTPLLGVC